MLTRASVGGVAGATEQERLYTDANPRVHPSTDETFGQGEEILRLQDRQFQLQVSYN